MLVFGLRTKEAREDVSLLHCWCQSGYRGHRNIAGGRHGRTQATQGLECQVQALPPLPQPEAADGVPTSQMGLREPGARAGPGAGTRVVRTSF